MQPQLKEVSVLGHGGFRRLAYAEWGRRRRRDGRLRARRVAHGRDFDMLAAALAERGRPGRRARPARARPQRMAGLAAHYTDRAYTGAMSALIARLDVEQVDWIGTSLGGHIGMMLASEHATPVRRLVLNDFGARVSAAALRRIGGYLGRAWRFESLDELEAHLRESSRPSAQLTDAQWQHLAHAQRVADDRRAACASITIRPSAPALRCRSGWTSCCGSCGTGSSARCLILRGEDSDLLCAATVDQMLKRGACRQGRPGERRRGAGCGHAPALMDAGADRASSRTFSFPANRESAAARDRMRASPTT